MPTSACLFLPFFAQIPANTTLVGSAKQGWSKWAKPEGVFHYTGVATEDQTAACPLIPVNSFGFFRNVGDVDSSGFSRSAHVYGGYTSSYTGATSPTYSTYDSGKAFQLAVKRSTYGIGSEIWCSFDWRFECLPNSSVSGYEPTAEYKSVFRWGDVEIRCKSTTWTGSNHTVVFSIRNNGSEVTTLSVAGVTNSTRQFMRIHVKLDATTGLIDCDCNGTAQAASYTNQNTVTTTSLASAPFIYFGPPIFDNNSNTAYPGSITNAYFSTSAWSSGRPISEYYPFGDTVGSGVINSGTMTGWLAEGTGAGTVANALGNSGDAKAARGYGAGAEALFPMPAIVTGNLSSSVLAIEIHCLGVSNRDLVAAKRLSLGMSLSGVSTMGTSASAIALPTDVGVSPPATNYRHGLSEFFTNPAYTISDFTDLSVRFSVL